MIYLDANIFIHAYYKLKKGKILSSKVKWIKEEAKKIIQKINDEEGEFCTSLIQLSEIVHLLKTVMSWEQLKQFLMGLISNNAIEIVEVSKLMYINAIDKITKYNIDANDISAYLIMKEMNINQIYTVDKHFRNFGDINCIPKIPDEFN